MAWTSGRTAACRIASSIVTRSITTDVMTPHHLARYRQNVLYNAQHCAHLSRELNMNATVSDQGRVPDMPQRNGVGKAPSQKTKVPPKAGSATWLVPALLVLSVVPLAAGAVRLTEPASGAEITPANARFFAAPLPIVLHIVGAGVYAMGARSSSQA